LNGNILLFCPKFFGYENNIKSELERHGFNVMLHDERPSNSFLFKALLRLRFHRLLYPLIRRYYRKIFESNDEVPVRNLVFVNIEAADRRVLLLAKKKFPDTKFTLYMWDSFRNKPNAMSVLDIFDVCCSFDRLDSLNTSGVEFLPLFFCPNERVSQAGTKYDICFVGTAHGDRVSKAESVIEKARLFGSDIQARVFYYSPSRAMTFFRLIFDRTLSYSCFKKVSYASMDRKSVGDVFGASKIVMDFPHKDQVGLTMRAIEIAFSGSKLITSNEDIVNYDFYRPENIYVYGKDDRALSDFWYSDVVPIPGHLKNKYSLSSWVKKIVGYE